MGSYFLKVANYFVYFGSGGGNRFTLSIYWNDDCPPSGKREIDPIYSFAIEGSLDSFFRNGGFIILLIDAD